MESRPLPPRPSLEQYRKQAKELLRDVRAADVAAIQRMRRHPRLAHADVDPSVTPNIVLAEAQHVIALEHEFASWPSFAAHLDALAYADAPVARFESAADAMADGNLPALERLLREDPTLAHARSTRAHRSTLLHYVSANGVEGFRQRTPPNVADIARMLLTAGAEVDATAESYGGGPWQTTLTLLVSSVHPARAGMQTALVDVLADCGAAMNGTTNDGVPLLTALAFHYPDAAAALVRRGARVDTLVAAAGVGDKERVRAMLLVDHWRGTRRSKPAPMPRWLQLTHDPASQRAQAFVWAATFGHARIVTLIAGAGTPLDASDKDAMTALHWASWMGHLDTMDVLLALGAPLEVRNRYGGTVLGSTVFAAVHSGRSIDDSHRGALPPVDYPAVVERLLAVGANVHEAAFPSGHADVDVVFARYRQRAEPARHDALFH